MAVNVGTVTIGTSFTQVSSESIPLGSSTKFAWLAGFGYTKSAGKIIISVGVKRTNSYSQPMDALAGEVTNKSIGSGSFNITRHYNGEYGGGDASTTWYNGEVRQYAEYTYTPQFNGNVSQPISLSFHITDTRDPFMGDFSGTIFIDSLTWSANDGLPTFTVTASGVEADYNAHTTHRATLSVITSDNNYDNIRVSAGTTSECNDGSGATDSTGNVSLSPFVRGEPFTTTAQTIYYSVIGDGYASTATGSVPILIHPIGSRIQVYDVDSSSWRYGEMRVYQDGDGKVGKMLVRQSDNGKDVVSE